MPTPEPEFDVVTQLFGRMLRTTVDGGEEIFNVGDEESRGFSRETIKQREIEPGKYDVEPTKRKRESRLTKHPPRLGLS